MNSSCTHPKVETSISVKKLEKNRRIWAITSQIPKLSVVYFNYGSCNKLKVGCETKKSKKRDGVDKSLSLARESRIHHPIETAEFVTMVCSSMRIWGFRRMDIMKKTFAYLIRIRTFHSFRLYQSWCHFPVCVLQRSPQFHDFQMNNASALSHDFNFSLCTTKVRFPTCTYFPAQTSHNYS